MNTKSQRVGYEKESWRSRVYIYTTCGRNKNHQYVKLTESKTENL